MEKYLHIPSLNDENGRRRRRTHENTVPSPTIAKYTTILLNTAVVSTSFGGTSTISYANRPKPSEKHRPAMKEQVRAPLVSRTFPTNAAKGYCPTIPLGAHEQSGSCMRCGTAGTYARAMVVS